MTYQMSNTIEEHIKSMNIGRKTGLRDAVANIFMHIRSKENELSLEECLKEVGEEHIKTYGENTHIKYFLDKIKNRAVV